MNPTPRDVLIEIVAKHGEPLLASPIRCEGLLKDYCGEFRREIFVLVSCLRVGVVDQLRLQTGPSVKLVCARLALRLEKNLAISGDIAKWGVESWAIALGLLDPQAATANLESVASALGLRQKQPEVIEPVEEIPSPETSPSPVPEELQPETVAPEAESALLKFLAHEPEPRQPVPDWSQPSRQIVVYPDASGQKPTFREAVREASANTCLILKPGVYKESLVIKRDLQIRADGQPGGVVIESLSSSVVVLDGACLFMAGLTLKGVLGKDKKALPAVEVKSGHLTLDDCDLTSDSATIVEVKGPQSEVILRRCHFHDGKAGGILFQEGGAGYLEECHFYQNKLSHIVIGKGCSPTLSACKISHSLMAGIYVNEGGEGLIENCDIWNNAMAGVQCRRGGNPHVRYCRISLNERYGVLVAEQGEGLFEKCQIFDNARTGVTVGQHSNPRFSGGQIFDNHGEGLEIGEQSQGEFFDVEIFCNEEANVTVKDKSNPQFHRCRIHESHKEGIRIMTGSKGLFEECEIVSNKLDGVSVGGESQPHFERCQILKNSATGVLVDDASAPTFQNCVIKQNSGIGFSCTRNSSPQMMEGEISGNAGGGLAVSSQGKGRWEKVRFIANQGEAVQASDGGRPTLRECHIEPAEGSATNLAEAVSSEVF